MEEGITKEIDESIEEYRNNLIELIRKEELNQKEEEKKKFEEFKKYVIEKLLKKESYNKIKKLFEEARNLIKKSLRKSNHSWDYGLDYKTTRKALTILIEEYFNQIIQQKLYRNYRHYLRLYYLVVALVQLTNVVRGSEALEGVLIYLDEVRKMIRDVRKRDGIFVKVRKHKSKHKEVEIIIPKYIPYKVLTYLAYHPFFDKVKSKFYENQKKEVITYTTFLKNNFGFSSHALRHSGATYWIVEKKENPVVVAKMTGHSNLNYLLTYTSKKRAEELKRKELL